MKKFLITEEQFKTISNDQLKNKIKKIGNDIGVDWDNITLDNLVTGTKIEMEHGSIDPETNVTNDDLKKTVKIALAHLRERPDYYQRLKKFVERKLTKAEKEEEERLAKKMPKKPFKDQYGEKEGERIYYATKRKMAKKNA